MKKVWLWFLTLLSKLRGLYTIQIVSEEPETLKPKRIYLVGEGSHIWYAVFSCPCGCNEKIHTKFVATSRPRWSYQFYDSGTISLNPSIWRKKGCKSHFFVTKGRIKWCIP